MACADDTDDYAAAENGKKPANGHSSPKRKTPKTRKAPADNMFVDGHPEEAAKQN